MNPIQRTIFLFGATMMKTAVVVLFLCLDVVSSNAQSVKSEQLQIKGHTTLVLANDQVECSVVVDSNRLISDRLSGQATWLKRSGSAPASVETDADFKLEIMWTDWQAPKYLNNAENPVWLTKTDFTVKRHEIREVGGGTKELTLDLEGVDVPLFARLTYQLEPRSFYVKRRLSVADTSDAGHFLQNIWPRAGLLTGKASIVKGGGFGQPIALKIGKTGTFFGLEYPAADNTIRTDPGGVHISCGQEMGEKIGKGWLESEWVVEGLTPDGDVKRWFMKYVDDIRVVPLKPYTLYNSWYDLRSAEYPRVPEANVMNEANAFRIINLIKKNMIEKHNIQLDAFVLDDGWDVYESDWVLRDKQFPRGLKPIADELKRTNTGLGIWFGPTGGYSFRMKRVNWMKEHGYEVVGTTKNTAMFCLGGTNYSALFKKRVTDFAANDGVSYFKWDGIQFSCSEPDHGHPVGIYSRRAIMESLIDKCRVVREKNPKMFLNITSGTWLSPWWVKYANQIWMQGSDYGYADVPSISPRDAAITYRDFILYDDFTNNNWWFPIANLMTHGIIKGNLQMLGGQEEPLDKFTNEVLLYFARGVSMWELYISPDILTDGEWDAMGQAMHWARDRFPILSSTEMVGGDPRKRETYGYVHFNGKEGIIAARNPWIEARPLRVNLLTAYGVEADASSLVLERVYPSRWVSPKLYKAGESLELPLDGYETAIYELYPITEADVPLLAGAMFDVVNKQDGSTMLSVYESNPAAKLLNSDQFKASSPLSDALKQMKSQPEPVEKESMAFVLDHTARELRASFTLDQSVTEASLALLLAPEKGMQTKSQPTVLVTIDGRLDTAKCEKSEGHSMWHVVKVPAGKHGARIRIESGGQSGKWNGQMSVWLTCKQKQQSVEVAFSSNKPLNRRPMPPRPFPAGVMVKNVKLGEVVLKAE